MVRKYLLILLLLFVPAVASASTTVTGTMGNLGTGTVNNGAFIRFWLRGCGGNQPRVNGLALIGPSQGGVFYFDFAAGAGGTISGTLYSTRDSTGLLGGDIECGGSLLAVWYGMQAFVGGQGGPEIPVHAKSGIALDISTVAPLSINPVTAATSPGTFVTYGPEPLLPNSRKLQAGTNTTVDISTPGIVKINASGGGGGSGGCGGLWISTTPYTLGCVVTLNGSIFVSLDSNTNSPPAIGNTDWLLRGASGLVDVTYYGARATDLFNSFQATANCNTATPNTITALSLTGDWQGPGDGIALIGCGPAAALSTPAAPTVTVVEPSDLVGTGYTVAASGLGSTTYTVKIINCDAGDGCTAASSATTVTNGPASLGTQSTSLTSCARAGIAIGCVAASTENIKVGALVVVEDTKSNTNTGDFDGWYRVSAVADTTHFSLISGLNTNLTTNNAATATSATGGRVVYKLALQIARVHDAGSPKFCAYLTAPIAAFIGCSRPNGSEDTEDWLEYFGATESGNLVRPLWVGATPPGAASSDILATTLTSTISGDTFTIADNVQTTVTGASANYDNSKAFTAACSAAQSGNATLYIPPGQTSSYAFTLIAPTNCAGGIAIQQWGNLDLENTLTLQSTVNWNSYKPCNLQFALSNGCGTPVFVGAGYPGIYLAGTAANTFTGPAIVGEGNFENPTQTGNNNGILGIMADEVSGSTWRNSVFQSSGDGGSSNDYTGIGLLYRCQNFGCLDNNFDTTTTYGGPSQTPDTTWTAEVMGLYAAGNMTSSRMTSTVRGWFWQSAGFDEILEIGKDQYHCQACEMPMFTFSDPGQNISGQVSLYSFFNDTGTQPDVAAFTHFFSPINLYGLEAPGANAQGVRPNILSGLFDTVITHGRTITGLGQNSGVFQDGGLFTSTQGYGQTFAALAACGSITIWTTVYITDSPTTALQAIVSSGGGANAAELLCDGTNWTVKGGTNSAPGIGIFTRLQLPEQSSSPPNASNATTFGALSSNHWPQFDPNATGARNLCGSTGSFTSGHIVAANASGTTCDLVDGGTGTGSGTVTSFSANAITTGTQNFATAAVTSPGVTPALTFTLANAPAHKFLMNNTGGSAAPDYQAAGESDLPGTTVFTDIAATFGAHAYNFSAATVTLPGIFVRTDTANAFGAHLNDFSASTIKAPVAAGFSPTANGNFGYDSTNKNWHFWANSADEFLGLFASLPADARCVQTSVTASVLTLVPAAGACGSGSGPTLQVGTVNNASQTTLNFDQAYTTAVPAGAVAFKNTTGGIVEAQLQNLGGGGNAAIACTLTGTSAGQYLGFDGTPKCVNLTPAVAPNIQTGTTYTFLQSDLGRPVFLSNAASIAATLSAPGAYTANFYSCAKAEGAGTVTITPASGTIDGSGTLALTTGKSACIYTDGTNFYTLQ